MKRVLFIVVACVSCVEVLAGPGAADFHESRLEAPANRTTQPTRERAPYTDHFSYKDCWNQKPVEEMSDQEKPSLSVVEEPSDGSDERNIKVEIQEDGYRSTYDVNFGKPAKESGDLIIWRGVVKRPGRDANETMPITYIEQGANPKRKVFSIPSSIERRDNFSGNDGGRGPGTYYKMSLFDNQGNYALVGAEIDSSIPAQKVFSTQASCRGTDRMGFSDGAALFNSEDPILPRSILPEEIPLRKVDNRFVDVKRSELNSTEKKKSFASKILADIENLSPVRERFAKSLLDGSFVNEPVFKLRSAILESVKFEPMKESDRVQSNYGVPPVGFLDPSAYWMAEQARQERERDPAQNLLQIFLELQRAEELKK